MKFYLLLIFAILLILACSPKKNEETQKPNQDDNDVKVIVVSTNVKGIDQNNFKAKVSFLTGNWEEYVAWEKQTDSTRMSYKFQDMHFKYSFSKERRFKFKIYRKDSVVFETRGEYLLTKDCNKLQLLSNLNNDSIVKEGDTIRTTIRKIHFLNDTILRLEEDPNTQQKGIIMEFRKIKNRP